MHLLTPRAMGRVSSCGVRLIRILHIVLYHFIPVRNTKNFALVLVVLDASKKIFHPGEERGRLTT